MRHKKAENVVDLKPLQNQWKPLVLKAQRGEKQAIQKLIEESQARFFKFCIYLTKNEQMACDLYQESIIKAIENIGSMHEPYNFMSWLTMIARNVFFDSKKGRKNKPHLCIDDLNGDIFVDLQNPSLSIEIRRTLDTLNDSDRLVLLLIDMQGYSYSEAAEVMNLTENAVRSRLHRARKAFAVGYQQSA